jgi:endonuclease III
MPRTAKPNPDRRLQSRQVVRGLAQLYPDSECALHFRNPFELLVATILSAQCTDKRVNLVTPVLFERFPDPKALSQADPQELESIIHSTGFFRAKAKNLRAMASALVDQHDGLVPEDLDAMTDLPGVGRKTAHVVLGTAFGHPSGVVVDTHVKRVAYRLGLCDSTDPVKIEHEIAANVARKEWINLSHRLIEHGRTICAAQKPKCDECGLAAMCPKVGVERKSSSPRKAVARQSSGSATKAAGRTGQRSPKR